MANELVGERSAHSLDEHGVVRVLQNAAVSLAFDVLEIFPRLALRRISLAHVAQPAGEFRQALTVSALT